MQGNDYNLVRYSPSINPFIYPPHVASPETEETLTTFNLYIKYYTFTRVSSQEKISRTRTATHASYFF